MQCGQPRICSVDRPRIYSVESPRICRICSVDRPRIWTWYSLTCMVHFWLVLICTPEMWPPLKCDHPCIQATKSIIFQYFDSKLGLHPQWARHIALHVAAWLCWHCRDCRGVYIWEWCQTNTIPKVCKSQLVLVCCMYALIHTDTELWQAQF